jgi:hypothetical protein
MAITATIDQIGGSVNLAESAKLKGSMGNNSFFCLEPCTLTLEFGLACRWRCATLTGYGDFELTYINHSLGSARYDG